MYVDVHANLKDYNNLLSIDSDKPIGYYLTSKNSDVIVFSYNHVSNKVLSCNYVCIDPELELCSDVRSNVRVLSKHVNALADMKLKHDDYVYATNANSKLVLLRKDLEQATKLVA